MGKKFRKNSELCNTTFTADRRIRRILGVFCKAVGTSFVNDNVYINLRGEEINDKRRDR